MWDCLGDFFNCLQDEGKREAINTIYMIAAGIGASVIGGIGWLLLRRLSFKNDAPEKKPPTVPMVNITLDQYEARLAAKIAEAETKLNTAHDEEKAELRTRIDELKRRAADPEAALKEAQDTIGRLEAALEREGNELGAEQMAAATAALEAGDFSKADEIFAGIEAREEIAVQRAARAAFARGEIAEQEVRWRDAAAHFGNAARLDPTYDHLISAREFAWRIGDFANALSLGEKLIATANTEYGAEHDNYAKALNEHALTLKDTGRYDEAEPLYRQAIEIGKDTLGVAHPAYAIYLNNLAGLLKDTGRYDEAEPLYRQAVEITKATLGATHPTYSKSLNNLAGLLHIQDRYDEAEPLFLQATEFRKTALGERHPDYGVSLWWLAELYRKTNREEQAKPLFRQVIEILENTLGADHPDTQKVKANYERFLAAREEE